MFFFRKTIAHDIEVQKLYEEMEQQIRNERARIKQQVGARCLIISSLTDWRLCTGKYIAQGPM